MLESRKRGREQGGVGFKGGDWEFSTAYVEFGMTVSYLVGDVNTGESSISECEVGEEEQDWRSTFLSLWH